VHPSQIQLMINLEKKKETKKEHSFKSAAFAGSKTESGGAGQDYAKIEVFGYKKKPIHRGEGSRRVPKSKRFLRRKRVGGSSTKGHLMPLPSRKKPKTGRS